MKEITLEDLGLTPEEMELLVKGSQRFMAVREEDGSLAPVDLDKEDESQTS